MREVQIPAFKYSKKKLLTNRSNVMASTCSVYSLTVVMAGILPPTFPQLCTASTSRSVSVGQSARPEEHLAESSLNARLVLRRARHTQYPDITL
jgi:hypothetical protein